jgi:hypothetical protein
MWTAFPLVRIVAESGLIACYQISGLFARVEPDGQDGVRHARSKHIGDIRVPV